MRAESRLTGFVGGGVHAGCVEDLPKEVIEARLALAEALDALLLAGQYQIVGEAIKRVRQDLRVLSTCARREAAAHGETIPPIRPPRSNPQADVRLAEALAQIEASMGMNRERQAREAAGENVTFIADQLDKRNERRLRRPKPGLML